MAIQFRRGNSSKFNGSKLVPGEIAIVLDRQKIYVAFDGQTKEILLVADASNLIADMIETATDTVLDSESGNPVANSTVVVALGEKMDKSNPSGSGSVSIGRKDNTVAGANSMALGYSVEASGNTSVALGYMSKASGNYSFAVGNGSIASGASSIALGYNAVASDSNSIVIGPGNTSSNGNEVVVGKHNKPKESEDTARVFEVGTGSNSSNKRTSFFIDVNGNAVFDGNISAPMFTYENGAAVQIGVDGEGHPIKRMTVYGTDTSSWNSSGQTVMELESKNILAVNVYGYIQISDGAEYISVSISSAEIHDKNVVIKFPNGLRSATAKYCITVEYILLS